MPQGTDITRSMCVEHVLARDGELHIRTHYCIVKQVSTHFKVMKSQCTFSDLQLC